MSVTDAPGMSLIGWANPQIVGTTGPTGVETNVIADLGPGLYNPTLVGVTLTQAYCPIHQPGYPTRNSPGHMLMPGMTLAAGATLWLLRPEADALVAIGGATYSDMPPPVGQVPQPPPDPLPPAPYYAPVCSGPSGSVSADVGDALTCTQGTWQHSPTNFAFQWYRSDRVTWASTEIDGATTTGHLTAEEDDGMYVFCNVWASNAAGEAQSASNVIAVGAMPKAARALARPMLAQAAAAEEDGDEEDDTGEEEAPRPAPKKRAPARKPQRRSR
jgi:hypothetical protein